MIAQVMDSSRCHQLDTIRKFSIIQRRCPLAVTVPAHQDWFHRKSQHQLINHNRIVRFSSFTCWLCSLLVVSNSGRSASFLCLSFSSILLFPFNQYLLLAAKIVNGARETGVSGMYFVPFRSVPFRSVPFRSVPFRSVPFRSVPFRSVPFLLLLLLLLLSSTLLTSSNDNGSLVHHTDVRAANLGMQKPRKIPQATSPHLHMTRPLAL